MLDDDIWLRAESIAVDAFEAASVASVLMSEPTFFRSSFVVLEQAGALAASAIANAPAATNRTVPRAMAERYPRTAPGRRRAT